MTVLLVLVSACRGEPPRSERIDLLARFAETDSRQPILDLDLGAPAAAAHLGAGWSDPALGPNGESIRWSATRTAVVRAVIREPHDRILVVRCGTAAPAQTRPQIVAVRVNGRRVGTITVERELRDHRVLVPARYQRRGANEIALGMRVGRGVNRLPVAYDHVRLGAPEAERGPVPLVSDERLVLPAPATVEYFLRVPPRDPVLRFGLARTGTDTHLDVTALADGGTEAVLFTGDRGKQLAIDLERFANQIVRLRFVARGTGAMELRAPAIVSARPADGAPLEPTPRTPPNVLIFLVDTLRADHLGCYGYARPTSPHVDAFAREGILFERTVAQSSWTRPSVASLLTGLYPQVHGVLTLRDRLRATVPTLAELLRARGYRTAGFVTNVNVAPAWGFDRGFDVYRYFPEDSTRPRVHAGADDIEPHVFAWLGQPSAQPFFLYVHVTDPHAPYAPPSPYAERFADPSSSPSAAELAARLHTLKRHPGQATAEDGRALVARYDAEIAFVDAAFGRLLAELSRRGFADDTLVIFTADHGEEFLDHGGFEHGRTLYDELLRIPLLMRLPHGRHAGVRSSVLARQIDVLPTVLQVLGAAPPPELPGRPLLSRPDPEHEGAEAFIQTSLASRDLEGLVTGPWKIVEATRRERSSPEIFHTVADPRERDNRAAQAPILLGYARQRLASVAAQMPERTLGDRAPALDPAILERLRNLGYEP